MKTLLLLAVLAFLALPAVGGDVSTPKAGSKERDVWWQGMHETLRAPKSIFPARGAD